MQAVFDTNILIDYLSGSEKARNELSFYDNKLVSIITVTELLVGADSEDEERVIKSFLLGFNIINFDNKVVDSAVKFRKLYKLKLPDAVILSTAFCNNSLLVTRDKKDFLRDLPFVRIPY